MQNANFPTDSDGRVYHLYIKPGEAANRVLTVGDVGRAIQIARTPGFDIKFVRRAPRLFVTITGLWKGVPLTIISSLMGIPNADFTMRELRHCIRGPYAIVRIGTCGTPLDDARVGDLIIPDEYRTVLRNPDGFGPSGASLSIDQRYLISKPILPSKELTQALRQEVGKLGYKVFSGTGLSCCSFYSSQGRQDPNFRDENKDLVDHYVKVVPGFSLMEMESSHFCDLARCVDEKVCGRVYASACHIALAQRRSNDFLTNEKKHEIETRLGSAVLDTLVAFPIPDEVRDYDGCVWRAPGIGGDWETMKNEFQ
ncbi:Uridine phosphorylase 1 [Giardia muris]|uniref:Uridine phosphorylase 1 n=1 Tax=Giardia muris TaxID=5742 RepID=A0A4Z1SM59_GIAMU|nr:Uridine phosphorylase 1 [Giardia muris]|eukprot:TNJ26766.1 Uridine phosphorylase 1 [Giardia muris]